ncbi:alpha/beta hydrolase [Tateyamaria sp. ANG-S1]|uniref:alpha/beta fold hydrolase n=1 Tax=Tateyamaria sp. ANG-S1 TaxID=1577905 RepID=UPI00057D7AFA|nr:alpha/beta hydrolase [Tateyamaria sp. ANG-S1]KIC51369.1 alpha/beta hydrolase [Tateyamaria sp. ANG-S1]
MKPLVLVHGFLGGSEQWANLASSLNDHDVIALDLPGFGAAAADAPLPSIGSYADWVIETLREQGVSDCNLLGHSMGGMIAQEVARRDSVLIDKLVLYGTGPVGVLPGRFEPISESKRRAHADGACETARGIASTWLLELERSCAFHDIARLAEKATLSTILAGLEAMEKWSGVEALDHIVCDTLLIWGDRDRTYPWSQTEALWRGIDQTSLCVIPNCAHLVHIEEPDLFAKVLTRFLTTEEATRAEVTAN